MILTPLGFSFAGLNFYPEYWKTHLTQRNCAKPTAMFLMQNRKVYIESEVNNNVERVIIQNFNGKEIVSYHQE